MFMDKWQPDTTLIDRIQEEWSRAGVLNELFGVSQVDKSVRDIIGLLKDEPVLAQYVRLNFQLNQQVCDHHLTAQEAIDAMRQGTPYGIVLYSVLAAHRDCCGKDHKEDT